MASVHLRLYSPVNDFDLDQCTITIDSWTTNSGMHNYAVEDWTTVPELLKLVPLSHPFWRVDMALGDDMWGVPSAQVTTTAPIIMDVPLVSLDRWTTTDTAVRLEPLSLECNQCDCTFKTAGQLVRHVRCDHLGLPLPMMNSYSKQAEENRLHWSDWDADRTCDICSKVFDTHSSLRRHISSVHDGVRDFLCDQCTKY